MNTETINSRPLNSASADVAPEPHESWLCRAWRRIVDWLERFAEWISGI